MVAQVRQPSPLNPQRSESPAPLEGLLALQNHIPRGCLLTLQSNCSSVVWVVTKGSSKQMTDPLRIFTVSPAYQGSQLAVITSQEKKTFERTSCPAHRTNTITPCARMCSTAYVDATASNAKWSSSQTFESPSARSSTHTDDPDTAREPRHLPTRGRRGPG